MSNSLILRVFFTFKKTLHSKPFLKYKLVLNKKLVVQQVTTRKTSIFYNVVRFAIYKTESNLSLQL